MARSAAALEQPAVSYSEIDLSGDFALSSPARRVKAKTIHLPGDVHTALLAAGGPSYGGVAKWLLILALYDLTFAAIGYAVFDFVVED